MKALAPFQHLEVNFFLDWLRFDDARAIRVHVSLVNHVVHASPGISIQ